MAKVVWKTTPKAAYEWAEIDGGESMKDYERSAMLDDFIAENGLVPVETGFVGEVPTHKYGRYKASGAPASALAPSPLAGREGDVVKANSELDKLRSENARLLAELDRQPKVRKAKLVDPVEPGIGSSGAQDAEDARDTLNQQDGVDIVASGAEVREDMSSADRSDTNPKVK